jgi:carbamoyl-phosphate synthase large subunit
VSKAAGIPLVDLAVDAILGRPLPAEESAARSEPGSGGFLISVKKPVLPFDRFPGADTLLGPEMKSTGEVMGTGADFGEAYAKAQAGAGEPLPLSGRVFLSVRDADKRAVVFLARQLESLGWEILATGGTARFLAMNGVAVSRVCKVGEGSPNVVERIRRGEIHLIMNTPMGKRSHADEREIRLAAVERGVPLVTTLPGAVACVCGIAALSSGGFPVRALQDFPEVRHRRRPVHAKPEVIDLNPLPNI